MLRRLLIGLGVLAPSAVLAGSIPRTTLNVPMPEGVKSPPPAIVQNPTQMNVDICNALGLNPYKVQGVTISLRPQRAALVRVEHILTNDEVRVVGKIVKNYKLSADES